MVVGNYKVMCVAIVYGKLGRGLVGNPTKDRLDACGT